MAYSNVWEVRLTKVASEPYKLVVDQRPVTLFPDQYPTCTELVERLVFDCSRHPVKAKRCDDGWSFRLYSDGPAFEVYAKSDNLEVRPDSSGEVLLTLPLCDGGFWAFQRRHLDDLLLRYPSVLVESEARRAAVYLGDHPHDRKSAAGMMRFLDVWMRRSMERASFRTIRATKDEPVPRARWEFIKGPVPEPLSDAPPAEPDRQGAQQTNDLMQRLAAAEAEVDRLDELVTRLDNRPPPSLYRRPNTDLKDWHVPHVTVGAGGVDLRALEAGRWLGVPVNTKTALYIDKRGPAGKAVDIRVWNIDRASALALMKAIQEECDQPRYMGNLPRVPEPLKYRAPTDEGSSIEELRDDLVENLNGKDNK